MASTKPRMGMSFVTEWGGKDFVVLTWEPGGRPALVIQSAKPLDAGARARAQAALCALLVELGFPEIEKPEVVRPGPVGPVVPE